MTLPDLMHVIQHLAFSQEIRESSWLFPAIETSHVLALTLVVGSISIVDLRLLGLTSRKFGVLQLSTEILPWTWTSFVFAVLTGGLLFCSRAETYYANWPFRLKMILMVLAGLNMAIFHFRTFRHVRVWDHQLPPPGAVKFAGGLSLFFWIFIVMCGRWIGFTT